MSGEGSNSGSVSAVPPHSPTRASAQNSHSTVTMWLLNTGRFTNTAAAATRGDLRRCKEGLGSREWEKKCVCSCSWLAEWQEYQTANERAPWHLPQEYFSPCLTASAAPQFDIKYAVWLVSSGRKRESWSKYFVPVNTLFTGKTRGSIRGRQLFDFDKLLENLIQQIQYLVPILNIGC